MSPILGKSSRASSTRGSTHDCTIIKKTEKVAILELPYGLEGICYNQNLQKEDQSIAQKDDTLPFVVTDFSASNKRIVLSHTYTFKKPKRSKTFTSEGAKEPTLVEVSRTQEATKSTLGELEGFSSLKKDPKKKKKEEE